MPSYRTGRSPQRRTPPKGGLRRRLGVNLLKLEPRGATERNTLERQVKRTRTQAARELRQRRRAAEVPPRSQRDLERGADKVSGGCPQHGQRCRGARGVRTLDRPLTLVRPGEPREESLPAHTPPAVVVASLSLDRRGLRAPPVFFLKPRGSDNPTSTSRGLPKRSPRTVQAMTDA